MLAEMRYDVKRTETRMRRECWERTCEVASVYICVGVWSTVGLKLQH